MVTEQLDVGFDMFWVIFLFWSSYYTNMTGGGSRTLSFNFGPSLTFFNSSTVFEVFKRYRCTYIWSGFRRGVLQRKGQ